MKSGTNFFGVIFRRHLACLADYIRRKSGSKIIIRHFQSRAWGKRPSHNVRPPFLLMFLVVLKNARQFHRGCRLKDSALPRDRDGITRSSCPRTTPQARSRAVYSGCPPYFKQTHGAVFRERLYQRQSSSRKTLKTPGRLGKFTLSTAHGFGPVFSVHPKRSRNRPAI